MEDPKIGPIQEEQQRKASRQAAGGGSALGNKAKHPDERSDAKTQESGEAPTAGENPALPTTLKQGFANGINAAREDI